MSSALFAIFVERWRRTAPPFVRPADLAGFLDRNAPELAAELSALEDLDELMKRSRAKMHLDRQVVLDPHGKPWRGKLTAGARDFVFLGAGTTEDIGRRGAPDAAQARALLVCRAAIRDGYMPMEVMSGDHLGTILLNNGGVLTQAGADFLLAHPAPVPRSDKERALALVDARRVHTYGLAEVPRPLLSPAEVQQAETAYARLTRRGNRNFSDAEILERGLTWSDIYVMDARGLITSNARTRNPDRVSYGAWTKRGKAAGPARKFSLEAPEEASQAPEYPRSDEYDSIMANLASARRAEAQAGAGLSPAQRKAGADARQAAARYLGPGADIDAALRSWNEGQRLLAEQAVSLQNEVDAEMAL